MQRHTQGILYVFKVVGDDVYKIGFTTKADPSTGRLPNVQTGNHEDLVFVHMWPGTLGDELDLHEALRAFRSRASGSGEWYRMNVGLLVQAISDTGQAILRDRPSEAPESLSDDPDGLDEHAPVYVRSGPYKGLTGFYSLTELRPLTSIPEAYQKVALEHYSLDEDGEIPTAEVFLEALDETVYLPPTVLDHPR